MFLTSNVLCSLRLFKLRAKEQIKEYNQKDLPKKSKTDLKILNNAGLIIPFFFFHLCPGLVLHIWQGYLTFSYYFIIDRIVCVLVTFYQ